MDRRFRSSLLVKIFFLSRTPTLRCSHCALGVITTKWSKPFMAATGISENAIADHELFRCRRNGPPIPGTIAPITLGLIISASFYAKGNCDWSHRMAETGD